MASRKLTDEQLAERGPQRGSVRMRQIESRNASIAAVVTPIKPETIEVPAELTDETAIEVFKHVTRHFKLDVLGKVMLVEMCLTLQRCHQIRAAIDAHSSMADVPRHLMNAERDAKQLYERLSKSLGL